MEVSAGWALAGGSEENLCPRSLRTWTSLGPVGGRRGVQPVGRVGTMGAYPLGRRREQGHPRVPLGRNWNPSAPAPLGAKPTSLRGPRVPVEQVKRGQLEGTPGCCPPEHPNPKCQAELAWAAVPGLRAAGV